MKSVGFDSKKYTELQTKAILDRMDKFGGKLYLEVGGKIFDDMHASRILPGFLPDNKIRMLSTMKDKLEAMPENQGHLYDNTGKSPETMVQEIRLEQFQK